MLYSSHLQQNNQQQLNRQYLFWGKNMKICERCKNNLAREGISLCESCHNIHN